MNRHFQRLTFVIAVGTLFYATNKFCHNQTDGFQITKIISDLAPSQEWDTPQMNAKELERTFSGPFRFLGSGGQCYAFVSEDQRIVLKVFKMHHLRQYPWLEKIPLPPLFRRWRDEFLRFQKRKLERVFSSCKIAIEELKEETGLIALNLNPSKALKVHHVQLIDRLNIKHELDLSRVPFVLQYRADNAFKRLRIHLKNRDMDGAKKIVDEILAFMVTRFEKGIKDLDPAPRRNIGLLGDRAIAIDIGSFYSARNGMTKEEIMEQLRLDTRRMRKWINKRSEELTVYFDSITREEHHLKEPETIQ